MNPFADPFAQRRGLVLGLTLAETLLLILFLLLLAYAVLLRERDQEIEAGEQRIAELENEIETGLSFLLEAMTKAGVPIEDPNELSLHLRELSEGFARMPQLEHDLELYTRLIATPEAAADLATGFETVENSPPPEWVLEEWLAENSDQPKDLENEADTQPESLGDALAAIERLESQVSFFERQQEEAGNGLTYPPCWSRLGKPVYIYDALLLDSGIQLTAVDDRQGMDMAGLVANGPEPPMGTAVTRATFLAHTQGMFDWSVRERCRFYVRLADGTSLDNKPGYQQARRTVEQHFYIYEDL